MSQPYITSVLPYNQEIGVQQNLLNKGFELGLEAELGYESIAKNLLFATNSGNTLTYTRKGLFAPVTAPLNPSNFNTLDNGITATNFLDEQYVIRVDTYADSTDLNIFANTFGVADVGVQNAYNLGESSRRSLDLFRRDTMLKAYMGGNSRVTATLGAPSITIAVDDIRGFDFVIPTTGSDGGRQVPTSATNPLPVLVGSTVYTCIAATPDLVNASSVVFVGGTALGQGISGTLTFTANVSVLDGTSGNKVQSAYAPLIVRPNDRLTTADIISTDQFTVAQIRRMLTTMRNNAVPRLADGSYALIMSPESFEQINGDPEFQRLYRGSMTQSPVYNNYHLNHLLGCNIIVTELPPIQSLGNLTIQRPMMVGRDSLLQARAQAMEVFANQKYSSDTYDTSMVKNVMMITRKPIQRIPMLIAQSWFYAGGWTATTDQTTNPTTIPTASNAYFKRAVICEHA